jgi:glutamine synthetase
MSEFNYQRLDKKNYTNEDIKRIIEENDIKFIKLQFVDMNGHVKNLSIPASHIDRALNNDMMLDGSSIKGFRSIETSDMFFVPDRKTVLFVHGHLTPLSSVCL